MSHSCSKDISIAVLAPEYPLPTHTFIRREIECLRAFGADVLLFSTRAPTPEKRARGWADTAATQPFYLVPFDAKGAFDAALNLPRAPFWSLFLSARAEGKTALKDALICLPVAARLAAECKRRNVRHIHAHMASRSALIAALAARMAGLPYSITHHGPLRDFGPNQRFKWSHAAFANIITRELADELSAALAPQTLNQIVIQPMGVDSDWFSRPDPYKPRRPGEPLKVFSCGRINRAKGHDILIEAVAFRVSSGENIALEIAGGYGPEQAAVMRDLEEIVKTHDLGPHVTFMGPVSEEVVRDKMTSAHLFVLASRYEAFGVVYIEAMSCGVPVIGTSAGGVPDIIVDGECGLLVPPEDPKALARAMEQIGSDPDLAARFARDGRARVVEKFPIEASARQLLRHAFPDDFTG